MSHSQTLTAADVMCAGFKSVPLAMTLPKLEKAFVSDKVTGYPVVEQGVLVGVVSRSDVVRQLCTERHVAETVSDFHFDEKNFFEIEMQSFQQVANRVGERIESLTVEDVMNERPCTIPVEMPIRDVAHQFITHHIHRLLVTDQGVLVGIITTIDLTRLIADGRLTLSGGN